MINRLILKNYFSEKSNDLMIVRMLLSVAMAVFSVSTSLFLKAQGFSNSSIGLITAIAAFVSLVISLISTIPLEKVNEYKLFLLSITLPFISILALAIFPGTTTFLIYLTVSSAFTTISTSSFSIIFKDISTTKEFVRKESKMYAFLNIGWFVGPLVGGLVIDSLGFVAAFLLSAFAYLCSLTISLALKLKLKKKVRKKLISTFSRIVRVILRKKI